MSSVNPHYTFEYSQPEEYHYSHDSVFLSRIVFDKIKTQGFSCKNILDLCAGCGVVGMDLLVHLDKDVTTTGQVRSIDFLEIQKIYTEHFEENRRRISKLLERPVQLEFLNHNYNELSENSKKYDLIISNPPYFRLGHGTLSNSEFKNRCRFFLDSDFKTLVTAIEYSLTPTGRAFVLLKSLERHGIDIREELQNFNLNLKINHLGLVRETDLYEISRA